MSKLLSESTTDSPATLTLQDIADLAKVRRPVVSMWRKRRRLADGSDVDFPPPVTPARGQAGVEHFDRDEVVDYLRRTGRGNNPEFDLDTPAGRECLARAGKTWRRRLFVGPALTLRNPSVSKLQTWDS